jgi:hypothetical protein
MAQHDTAEIDAVVARFYAAFDNRGGRAPASDELRELFAPGASITRVSGEGADTWDVDAFIAPRAAMLSDGSLSDFHEWETEAETTVLDNIASRRSRYAKDGRLGGAPYAGAGRKFIQLCRVDGRWRIAAVLWEDDA